jgi:hypothetical protein
MFRRFLEMLLGLEPGSSEQSASVDDLLLSPHDTRWGMADTALTDQAGTT